MQDTTDSQPETNREISVGYTDKGGDRSMKVYKIM